MKKLERLLWIGAFVVVLGLIWYFGVREGFTSKAQIEALAKKLDTLRLDKDPDVLSLKTQPAIVATKNANGGSAGAGDSAHIRHVFPLALIAAFGDVQGNTFDVKASFIDGVLSGGFDTSKLTAANAIALAELSTGKPVEPRAIEELRKNEKNMAAMVAALYYSLSVGGCAPTTNVEIAKLCQQFQKDPKLAPALVPWNQTEKDILRKIAAKVFNVVPDTPLAPAIPVAVPALPAPATPPVPSPSMASGSAYAASCTKCTLVNNQLSCSCDVTPR